MKQLYTIDLTYEREDPNGTVLGSLEARYMYTVTPVIEKPGDPVEDAVLELVNIHVETATIGEGHRWIDATPTEWVLLEDWWENDEDVREAALVKAAEDEENMRNYHGHT